MIPVNVQLEDFDGWRVECQKEWHFLSVPRVGEHIKFNGTSYKVRKVTHVLGTPQFAPTIELYAKGD